MCEDFFESSQKIVNESLSETDERFSVISTAFKSLFGSPMEVLNYVEQHASSQDISSLKDQEISSLILSYQKERALKPDEDNDESKLDSLSLKSDTTATMVSENGLVSSLYPISGSRSLLEVSYLMSDVIFALPDYSEQFCGSILNDWITQARPNLNGLPTKVVALRSGLGDALVGSTVGAVSSSVVVGSRNFVDLISTVAILKENGSNIVFHVVVQEIDSKLCFRSDYSAISRARQLQVPIFASSTVEDSYYTAIFSEFVSKVLNTPVIHFTNGNRNIGAERVFETLGSKGLISFRDRLGSAEFGSDVGQVITEVSGLFTSHFGYELNPIETHGIEDGEIVIISDNTFGDVIKEAVVALNNEGLRVTYVNARMYRPLPTEAIISSLSQSTKHVVIVDQGLRLDRDIETALFASNSKSLFPINVVSFGKELVHIHPLAVFSYLKSIAANERVPKILSYPLQHYGTSLFSFKNEFTVLEGLDSAKDSIANQLCHVLCGYDGLKVHKNQQFISTSAHPAKVTSIRFGANDTLNKDYLIGESNFYLVFNLDACKNFDILNSIAHNSSLLLNSGRTSEDLGNIFDSRLVEKNITVFSVDAECIAREYSIFYGKYENYVGSILLACSIQVLFDGKQRDNILGRLIDSFESLGPNERHTRTESVLNAVTRISRLHFDLALLPKTQAVPLRAFPVSTVPSALHYEKDEESETQVSFASKTLNQAVLPILFPSAYSIQKVYRPEIESAFEITVSKNIRLTPAEYERNVFHMELDITGTGLKYDIGDALGVYAKNPLDSVLQFLEAYGIAPDQLISVDRVNKDLSITSEFKTVGQLFVNNIDLFGKPGKSFYQFLAVHANDDDEKEGIASILETTESFEKYVSDFTPTFADLLLKFKSSRPKIHDLIVAIPPIKPRHYSISSSQRVHPNSVHLLVVLVDWVNEAGTKRFGQASKYLMDAVIGEKIAVTVKPSVMRLPESLAAPVIMSGLGTGMAPFRAFIEERWYWKQRGEKVGPMVLYFGSRNKSNEYLYGEELDAYCSEGVLSHLRLAFSRDQKEKIYIQHKISADRNLLHRLLVEEKGSFYLCGPTWPVPDVANALLDCFQQSQTKEMAHEYLEHLKESERYILEVFIIN